MTLQGFLAGWDMIWLVGVCCNLFIYFFCKVIPYIADHTHAPASRLRSAGRVVCASMAVAVTLLFQVTGNMALVSHRGPCQMQNHRQPSTQLHTISAAATHVYISSLCCSPFCWDNQRKTCVRLGWYPSAQHSQPDVNDGALPERLAAANSINLDKSLLRQNWTQQSTLSPGN